jgi:hypothetical protein
MGQWDDGAAGAAGAVGCRILCHYDKILSILCFTLMSFLYLFGRSVLPPSSGSALSILSIANPLPAVKRLNNLFLSVGSLP